MKLGVDALDEMVGEIREGDILLIESVGTLGVEILAGILENTDEEMRTLVILPRGASEGRMLRDRNAEVLVIGTDIHAERLYELLYLIRKLGRGTLIIAVRLDSLFSLRPKGGIYEFIEDLAATAQEKGLVLVATVDKRNLDEKLLSLFENFATHVIDITEITIDMKVLQALRIKKSPRGTTGFREFRIVDGRIVIKDVPYTL